MKGNIIFFPILFYKNTSYTFFGRISDTIFKNEIDNQDSALLRRK